MVAVAMLVYNVYKGIQRIANTPAGQQPGAIGEETGGLTADCWRA